LCNFLAAFVASFIADVISFLAAARVASCLELIVEFGPLSQCHYFFRCICKLDYVLRHTVVLTRVLGIDTELVWQHKV